MQTNSHLERWFDLPVEQATAETIFSPAKSIYFFGYSYDDEDVDPVAKLAEFLESPDVEKTIAIVTGMEDEGGSDTTQGRFLDVLEANKAKLPCLRGLFLGDILQEENEISWIKQDDISRALAMFPGLKELIARGQDGLQFKPCEHQSLTKLVIETGGIPKAVLHGIAGSVFPELEHLELWLGTDEYGFDGGIEDVVPLLHPGLFPKLKHLALGNSSIEDKIAAAVAESPLLDRLESLDLSLGTMTDEGAVVLLESPGIKKLKRLNLHRNYLTYAMCARFKALGIEVDTDEQESDSSRSPITNLQLGNERGDLAAVRNQLGEAKWAAALNVAVAAARSFPTCHYLAVDLIVDSHLRRFAVAEVNAFGDLLPRVTWGGMSTFVAELKAWQAAAGP